MQPGLNKPEEEKKGSIAMVGRGVKIGGGIEAKKGEWRCKVCKFKNAEDDADGQAVIKCTMCKEPKQVMKEAPAIVSQIPKVPPQRVHKEEVKVAKPTQPKLTGGIRGLSVGGASASSSSGNHFGGQSANPGGPRIMTLG